MVRTSFWIFMTIILAALLLAQTSIAGEPDHIADILQLIAG
ncbi:hypothetical protein [Leucothrix pacifica]|nr:hypothetical protein [Leucothrix pacifica]